MIFIRQLIIFSFLLSLKCLSLLFYRFKVKWIGSKLEDKAQWDEVRLFLFLNHTSLMEPVFAAIFPNHQLWRAAGHLLVPGADITLKRPFVGRLLKMIGANVIGISRKKDDSWKYFLSQIKSDSLVAIIPEGRMKRSNGLDKHGNQMDPKGGFYDILEHLQDGKILILYSEGLHHIQIPDETYLKIFKTIKGKLEWIDIKEYKKQHQKNNSRESKLAMIEDLKKRMKIHLE